MKQAENAFARDESGVITALSLFFLLIMLMVAGLGIDFMHAEMRRTQVQQTLDRAVLAAADLDQTLAPDEVVRDYFESAGLLSTLSGPVEVDEGLNYRTVSASGQIDTEPFLLSLVGLDTITSHAGGTAEERIANVEISLVLDISGSMASNNRMANLQAAAKEFVDTLLDDSNRDLVSISIVPYSEHVNAGPLIFDRLNTDDVHDYSHCIEFSNAQFSTAGYDALHTYDQVQHFQWGYPGWNDLTKPVCPRYDFERITAFSQDRTELHAQIDALQPRGSTAIFLGMKWATMLLDPSMRPVIAGLSADGHVDAEFASRPAEYSDDNTLKTIVLMTDGSNQSSYRISNWAYNHASEIAHWASYNLMYYLYGWVPWYNRSAYYYRKYSSYDGDLLLADVCDAARAEGIIVWSVGLEVHSSDLDEMRDCASTINHFFEAEGAEISEVFRTIARQVNFLRLTQ